jgi:hypothetical protein
VSGESGLTVRQLAAALAARPEEEQDLLVFSTADWTVVSSVDGIMDEVLADGSHVVEIS